MMKHKSFTLSSTITRPNDTTPYAVNDVINTSVALPITFAFPVNLDTDDFSIESYQFVSSNVVSAPVGFKLLLFSSPPDTPVDNAPFVPTVSQWRDLIGIVSFSNNAKYGSESLYFCNFYNPVYCSRKFESPVVYGVFTTYAAYTPIANEVFDIVLYCNCR